MLLGLRLVWTWFWGAVLGLLCWTLLFCGLFGSFWGLDWLVVCILVLGNCCVDLRCGLDRCCDCLLRWLMLVGLLIWLVSCWFGLVVLTFVVGYVAVLTSCAL